MSVSKKIKTADSEMDVDAKYDPSSFLEETIKLEECEINPWTEEPYSDRYFSILKGRKELPVHLKRKEFLDIYHNNQVMVFVGETGSGKTTQIPQFIVMEELARGNTESQVACTQPRRVAAMSVAERVAHEMDVKLGQQVGYSIRFEDKTSEQTKLRYMTDGMLLREAMSDGDLSRYSCIILDEAHERTLPTDILMGLLKMIIQRRPDLKIVVMSATLDAEKFQTYFDNAPLMSVHGRTFPVEVFYSADHQDDYTVSAIRTVLQIHGCEKPGSGDILLFLTGEEEIEDACRKVKMEADELFRERPEVGRLEVYPLYGSLPPQQQQQIFNKAPEGGRKVVISTNIAETSLTIDGIVYVIDPGFTKQKTYHPRQRLESLMVTPISKASAMQRAGRAGRTRPGKCFRLYTKDTYQKELVEQTYPESMRTNFSNTVLELLKLNIENVVKFDFIDPPSPETLMRALEELNFLGCIDDEGKMTELGRQCSLIPLDPVQAVTLIYSSELGCCEEILTIVAMLSVPPVFVRPNNARKEADDCKSQFEDPTSDHITLLEVYDEYIKQLNEGGEKQASKWAWNNFLNIRTLISARSVRNQLRDVIARQGHHINSTPKTHSKFGSRIRRALIKGYFQQVTRPISRKSLKTIGDNQEVLVHPSSGAKRIEGQWLLYHEYVITTSNYIRTVTTVKPHHLLESSPKYYDPKRFGPGSHDVVMTLEQLQKKAKK